MRAQHDTVRTPGGRAVTQPMHNTTTVSKFSVNGEDHITIHLDPENYDWHLDLHPGHTEEEREAALRFVEVIGMDVYDEEECEPDVLEDGTIRMWMSPKEPIPE